MAVAATRPRRSRTTMVGVPAIRYAPATEESGSATFGKVTPAWRSAKLAPTVVQVYPRPIHALTADAVTVTVTGATTVGSNVVVRVRFVLEKLASEEAEVLLRLRLGLGEADAAPLGPMYEQARSSGPTRPHPLTPPLPGILRTVGRAVALTDTARDILTRRGR